MHTATPACLTLSQRMIEDMRKLRAKTRQAYTIAVLKLGAYLKHPPGTARA